MSRSKNTTKLRLRTRCSTCISQSTSNTDWWNATRELKLEEYIIEKMEIEWKEGKGIEIKRKMSGKRRIKAMENVVELLSKWRR